MGFLALTLQENDSSLNGEIKLDLILIHAIIHFIPHHCNEIPVFTASGAEFSEDSEGLMEVFQVGAFLEL